MYLFVSELELNEPETVCQLVVGEIVSTSEDVDLPLQVVVGPDVAAVIIDVVLVAVVVKVEVVVVPQNDKLGQSVQTPGQQSP